MTKSSVPTVSRTWLPILVMMRMAAATQGESVNSIPILERGDPTGPIEKGTTYIVRPFMEEANRSLATFARASLEIQLPRAGLTPSRQTGMVSRFLSVEMTVLDSTRATSAGSVRVNQLWCKL